MSKVLVAFFSASGVTKGVAENLAKAAKADIYEIRPQVPYTDADLNWMDKGARSTVEMKDWNSRPAIVDDKFDVSGYETVFLGFPIWWYIAPTIINTFLEAHDFSNKKIILFGTSGGSRFGSAVRNLQPSVADSCEIIEGDVLNGNPSIEQLKEWAAKFL
ncbi:MAG: flavodoxin [Candidatus Gastranaerophilaceae bacterium]|nr:flavodoxin [Candidatus Gastranaerophilaceae bacterium]